MKKIFLLITALSLCVAAHSAGTWVTSGYKFRPDDKQDDKDDMFDLDHHNAYTWGVSASDAIVGSGYGTYNSLTSQLKSGFAIQSATITFYNIWDWTEEQNDRLWVNLLDTNYNPSNDTKKLVNGHWVTTPVLDLKKGVTTINDNADDIESTDPKSNYFYGEGVGVGGPGPGTGGAPKDGTPGNGYWTDPKGGSESKQWAQVTFTFTTAQLSTLAGYIMNGGATSGATGYSDFGFGFDPDCHYYNTGVELKIVTKKYFVPDGGTTVALLGFGFLTLAGFRRIFRR